MIILGIDTTTRACSVALLEDQALLAEFTLNIMKTHSERLMPLIDSALSECGVERERVGAVAVAVGPGSFTGLRIGISTARAFCQALSIPGIAVSTLEALALSLPATDHLVCPLLDARRKQVYSALYSFNYPSTDHQNEGARTVPFPVINCELEPAARGIGQLMEEIQAEERSVCFLGDGVDSYGQFIMDAPGSGDRIIAPPTHRYCRASLVAFRGIQLLPGLEHGSYEGVAPQYLRLPEAQRIALEKERARGGNGA